MGVKQGGERYMATKEPIIESLEAVLVPAAMRSIGGLNLVREVTVSDAR